MQYQISDAAAVAFARGFYTAIAHGRGVDEATASGRVAILGTRAGTLEWVTPVMYLRGRDSHLFVLPPRYSTGDGTSAQRRPPPTGGDHVVARDGGTADQSRPGLPGVSGPPASDSEQRRVRERRMAEAEFRTGAVRGQVAAFERLLLERNRNLAAESRRIEEIYNASGSDVFVATLQRALATSVYPDGLRGSCAATYQPEVGELLIEYELPRPDVVPDVLAYRYVETTNLVQPERLGQHEIEKLYQRLLARVTLRTVAEAFDVAPATLVSAIVLNGYVSAKDHATGKLIRPLLISTHIARDAFAKIMLDEPQLDPVACLRHLNAVVSPHPYDLEVVRPVVQFDLSKYKFVEEMDVVAGLGIRPDLLALKPIEFEHLIRQLFESIGMKAWITQASRDEGIDVVAYSDAPIVGGLCIIQAKRYSKIVGLEAVHALAGIMEDKHAAKGVLITTSSVGKASRHFAARNGRIEIIEGPQLRSMLKEHLGLDVMISLPRPRPST
jgi:restriction system protein